MSRCPVPPVVQYLCSLPEDAVIAGDPGDLKCLPATAKRAVVISTQLAPAYEVGYFLRGRQRMFADLRAVFGENLRNVLPSYSREVLTAGPSVSALRAAAVRAVDDCRAALG